MAEGFGLFRAVSVPLRSSLAVIEHRSTQGRENTVPAQFLLHLAREGETASGENTAPMALKEESVPGRKSPWKCDELDLGPDLTW